MLAVAIIGIIIAAAAAALVLVAREGARATADDGKNARAWSTAMAGLTWAQLHLDDTSGKAALQAAAGGTATAAAGLTIHAFDPDDAFAGVGSAPPAKGVSNANWKAFEDGHFAILGAKDALSASSILVRAVGRTGTSQVVLETNLQVNVLKSLPGAFTGCFGGNTQITYFDEESPYDYYGNMRFDGNGGVPIGMSADHDRLNGLARNTEQTTTPPPDLSPSDPMPNYPQGMRWRGTQSLRTEPLAGVSTRVGGTPASNMVSDEIGNLVGWDGNPYMANDPRIAFQTKSSDVSDTKFGLGLGADGRVDGISTAETQAQRGMPIIGYIGTPNVVTPADGGFRGEEDWAPFKKDDRARKGFYGCDNHSGEDSTLGDAARACMTGSKTGTAAWNAKGLYHSGRAWGFMSTILRQCTGSGDSINPKTGDPWFENTDNPNGVKCNPAFEYLENVAACTIMPKSVARGTNGQRPSGNSVLIDDFRGCHPGCLLAADFTPTDGTDEAHTPYRSVCINLDAETVTPYGPDIKTALNPASWTLIPPPPVTIDPLPLAPVTVPPTVVLPTHPRYIFNWTIYAMLSKITEFGSATLPGLPQLPGPVLPTNDIAIDAAGDVIKLPGFVHERGNTSLITRFDLTDRGPLGTCEQNCLGYGFGRDRTYGAHRIEPGLGGVIGTVAKPGECSAFVPKEPSGHDQVHCNTDYDRDGIFDRKTYAIASSYREECADKHDGVSWGPTFNISSTNPTIGGSGCVNRLPSDSAGAPDVTLTPFCDQGALSEITASVDALLASATEAAPANLSLRGTLIDGDNWFGGARCHMGSAVTGYAGRPDPNVHPHSGGLTGVSNNDLDVFGHPDYWIEDECPDPQIVKVTSALDVGHICGCGVLVLDDVPLKFEADAHLLWRGLVIWRMNSIGGTVWDAGAKGFASFIVEGGFLATGNQDFKIVITRQDEDATDVTNDENSAHKQHFRMNPNAIQEALNGQTSAIQAVRRIQ